MGACQGSMTAKGTLVLNRALIGASTEAIDYVLTHELCHLKHPNHRPALFECQGRIMPNWEARKLALERQMV